MLCLHDELLIHAPEPEADRVANILSTALRAANVLPVSGGAQAATAVSVPTPVHGENSPTPAPAASAS